MNSGDTYFRLFGSISILVTLFGAACAQANLKAVPEDEVSIKFAHIAKLGETKKYLIDVRKIPNAPPLPNGYKLFENKSYFIKTETIDLGHPMFSFKIPTNDEQTFRMARILLLTPSVMTPQGFEWRNCTMSEEKFPNVTEKEAEELFPNFATKKVKCEASDWGLKPEMYLAVVLQSQAPPTKPFTDLTATMEGSDTKPLVGNVSYALTLTNSGKTKIGELNILSGFNSYLTSFKPERGTCKRVQYGFGDGTAVCFLGELKSNETVKVHFDVSIIPQEVAPPNGLNWNVDAVMKENPLDPSWPVNMFSFEPLSGKKTANGIGPF